MTKEKLVDQLERYKAFCGKAQKSTRNKQRAFYEGKIQAYDDVIDFIGRKWEE